MSMPYFYLAPEYWGDEVTLEGQEAAHLSRALRLGPGAEVGILDGRGRIGRFRVRSVSKKSALLDQTDAHVTPRPTARAIMALAFSKAVRNSFFLEKAVELGADAIWLWQGEHSQGRLPVDAAAQHQGQLIAGAKQSVNPWLPEMMVFTQGVAALVAAASHADHRILPWEAQEGVPMLTHDLAGQPGLTVYVIGPEGGFSQSELMCMRDGGFTTVSLGARILRCETAATLCLGIHWWASQLPGRPAPTAKAIASSATCTTAGGTSQIMREARS